MQIREMSVQVSDYVDNIKLRLNEVKVTCKKMLGPGDTWFGLTCVHTSSQKRSSPSGIEYRVPSRSSPVTTKAHPCASQSSLKQKHPTHLKNLIKLARLPQNRNLLRPHIEPRRNLIQLIRQTSEDRKRALLRRARCRGAGARPCIAPDTLLADMFDGAEGGCAAMSETGSCAFDEGTGGEHGLL